MKAAMIVFVDLTRICQIILPDGTLALYVPPCGEVVDLSANDKSF